MNLTSLLMFDTRERCMIKKTAFLRRLGHCLMFLLIVALEHEVGKIQTSFEWQIICILKKGR